MEAAFSLFSQTPWAARRSPTQWLAPRSFLRIFCLHAFRSLRYFQKWLQFSQLKITYIINKIFNYPLLENHSLRPTKRHFFTDAWVLPDSGSLSKSSSKASSNLIHSGGKMAGNHTSPEWPNGTLSKKRELLKKVQRIAGNIFSRTIELSLPCLFSIAILIVFIYFIKYIWYIYINTPIGIQFVSRFYDLKITQKDITSLNPIATSIKANLIAIKISIPIAFTCQISYITNLAYAASSLFIKIFCWILPITIIIAYLLINEIGGDWKGAITVAIIPSSIVFPAFMRYFSRLIPDGFLLNMLFKGMQGVKNSFVGKE